jgi:hypothetical protein
MKAELIEAIQNSISEVEKTLDDDEPSLITQYDPLFRYMTTKPWSFELLSYRLQPNVAPPQSLLPFHFAFHRQRELIRNQFAAVDSCMLTLYDIKSQKSTQHELTVSSNGGTSYIELEENALMCIGGYPASQTANMLNLRSFTFTALQDLLVQRCAPGVARTDDCVYAFGGRDAFNTALKSCEKWNIAKQTWQLIAPMQHPRSDFTPCTYRLLFYLVDHSVRAIETFSPQTEEFAVLPITLPVRLQLLAASVAFVADGELCLLSYKQIARWKIESELEFRLSATDRYCWSNQQPLIMGPDVLIACEGQVMRFSLATYSFTGPN